jgi:hypothetical protein
LEEGKKAFQKLFKDKTGQVFEGKAAFEPVDGKYVLAEGETDSPSKPAKKSRKTDDNEDEDEDEEEDEEEEDEGDDDENRERLWALYAGDEDDDGIPAHTEASFRAAVKPSALKQRANFIKNSVVVSYKFGQKDYILRVEDAKKLGKNVIGEELEEQLWPVALTPGESGDENRECSIVTAALFVKKKKNGLVGVFVYQNGDATSVFLDSNEFSGENFPALDDFYPKKDVRDLRGTVLDISEVVSGANSIVCPAFDDYTEADVSNSGLKADD